jgi:glyoxylase-like metal-dependent hydrolase (beta-lactamase superfamily II)
MAGRRIVHAVAEVFILVDGYINDGDRVASTVGFVRDGDVLAVIDPGMVAAQAAILHPLGELGVEPSDITDVVFSHHHPDHTMNAGLFPEARVHDHWATYRGDLWTSRPADGFALSSDIRLMETPGHTLQDVTTLVSTEEGLVAFTHLWWNATGPLEDPYAPDPALLHEHRGRVLNLAAAIVPGHGPRFVPGPSTPR